MIEEPLTRNCYANPHGAQRPACYPHQFFHGEPVEQLCTCDEKLCNGAQSNRSAASSYLFLLITFIGSSVHKYIHI